MRKALARVGGSLEPSERAAIEDRVADVERAVAQGAAQPLKKANASLDEATQRLAVLLLEEAQRAAARAGAR